MILIGKPPAAAERDETGITDFGKDHGCTVLFEAAPASPPVTPPATANTHTP